MPGSNMTTQDLMALLWCHCSSKTAQSFGAAAVVTTLQYQCSGVQQGGMSSSDGTLPAACPGPCTGLEPGCIHALCPASSAALEAA